jgi:hypothetical protein
MKKLSLLGTTCLLIAMARLSLSGNQDGTGNQGIEKRFVGAWHLVWLEEQGTDGEIHKADCTGLLVCTRDGHMAVQVMFQNPPAATSLPSAQYAQGGYEASFGTYRIDESTHTFTFHVQGALVRSLIGQDLPRAFELSAKQLIVKSTHPDEHWRVAWEHY